MTPVWQQLLKVLRPYEERHYCGFHCQHGLHLVLCKPDELDKKRADVVPTPEPRLLACLLARYRGRLDADG